ncbi:response regulator [Peredibacter starrii]|uniref:Response regulator n=1 Tax=Peredibacter starrii TaxID=28202 RepID=A0AAX4HL18_9BACT|nr:response regulator [Peredibacter starrii]WPU63997.1 response regulator [Peredibacter starrii]
MKNILVVDDSAEARNLLEMILEDHGYIPIAASSGEEAIILLKTFKIDLIISDLEMRNGDGHWLLNQLKTFEKAPKIIIVSGDIRATEKYLISAGALAFFRKPYSLKLLMERVKSAF